ncbi:hypothetical protein [Microcoleus sp.]|uniref:hypothetical protein n=1 Tax=Microcoleus sp. TaxID=44472 RepID=UPI00403ED8A9
MPVQNLLFKRCLLVICYLFKKLLKRFHSEGRQARVNNNCIAVLRKVRYSSNAQCPMPNAQCPMPNAQEQLMLLRKAIVSKM